jgi:hypothetical protein
MFISGVVVVSSPCCFWSRSSDRRLPWPSADDGDEPSGRCSIVAKGLHTAGFDFGAPPLRHLCTVSRTGPRSPESRSLASRLHPARSQQSPRTASEVKGSAAMHNTWLCTAAATSGTQS